MPQFSKHVLRFGILAAGAIALMGCQSIRDEAGMGKSQPDEFAVVTKPALVMPPDYNLHPPRDGAPPVNQVAPTDAAQTALFEQDPAAAAKAMPGDYSEVEKQVLVSANATNPDHSIRQQVASDGRSMEASDDAFTKKVLFWQGKGDEGLNVDADAEAKRIDAQKNGGKATPQKTPASATIDKPEEKKGGWFGWLF